MNRYSFQSYLDDIDVFGFILVKRYEFIFSSNSFCSVYFMYIHEKHQDVKKNKVSELN